MDTGRLLHPRSIAVVGATEREGSYGGQTVLNLHACGFPGEVWPVNPGRASVHGRACFPSLSALDEAPDAVVVSVPAPGVPDVVEEAGVLGCGGAVVFGAGFAEVAEGRELQARLRESALRHRLPVCGPNGNGIVALHERAALWGDALGELRAGEVALISQSGNIAVNALATRRGLRLHTVVSCGNDAVLDAADWAERLAVEPGVRSIALYLEDDGDGERLCAALAACADAGVGVAVLKAGSSAAGAAAAAAHTGAVAGDQRVFRALAEEAGAAWAEDAHDLLELAKALAVPGARPARREAGLAVLTCSGGDSSLAADEAERLRLSLPPLAPDTARRLRELLPSAATIGNPLDYTALIWGESDTLAEIVAAVGRDPGVDQVLVFYDRPAGLEGDPKDTWDAVAAGIRAGVAASPVPVAVASTLPELLDDESARAFAEAGAPALAGMRSGLRAMRALQAPPGDAGRLRQIGAACARRAAPAPVWLSEHEAKELVSAAGVPVVDGRVVADEDDAAAAFAEFGAPVAMKLSAPELRHKTETGSLELNLRVEDEVRAAYRRLVALNGNADLLVERMAPPGAELLVSARTDAVVPALAIGLGGIYTELFDDAAIVPLPASAERVERALLGLRGAGLLTGARGGAPLDIGAVADLAVRLGEALLEHDLALVELNPVLVRTDGAVAVDAVARVG